MSTGRCNERTNAKNALVVARTLNLNPVGDRYPLHTQPLVLTQVPHAAVTRIPAATPAALVAGSSIKFDHRRTRLPKTDHLSLAS